MMDSDTAMERTWSMFWVCDDILMHMYKQYITLLVFFDLSVIFDTVVYYYSALNTSLAFRRVRVIGLDRIWRIELNVL